MLLLNVHGPCDRIDLRRDENDPETVYPTNVDAAVARGLMHDDSLWEKTIRDAMDEKRSLSERIRWFAIFIANTLPLKPAALLDRFFEFLTTWPGLSRTAKREKLLRRIEYILRQHGIHPNDGKIQHKFSYF